MMVKDLAMVPASALVARFTDSALAQFDAEMGGDIQAVGACVKEQMAIAAELKARPGDQRSSLLELYDHPNGRVALNAARMSFALAPSRARAVIQTIADSKKYSVALDAGMCLSAMDMGLFKPS